MSLGDLSEIDVAVLETVVALLRKAADRLVLAHRVLGVSFDAEPCHLIDQAVYLVDLAHDLEQTTQQEDQ